MAFLPPVNDNGALNRNMVPFALYFVSRERARERALATVPGRERERGRRDDSSVSSSQSVTLAALGPVGTKKI